MNEKNIELTSMNSPNTNTSDRQFSFGQNMHESNNNNISEVESNYNGTTNMTVDINSNNTNNKTRRYTNIEYNKKSKLKSMNAYNCSSLENICKKLYICIFSLINHLDFLSERKISVQVVIVYSLLMIILILGIIFIKAIHITDIIRTLTNKNYFLFYVNNIIDSQREIKTQLDELNNHDIISVSNDPLLFMRIYTEELVDNKILNKDSLILEQDLQNIYSDLGENYKLSDDLYKLSDIYNDSSYRLDYNLKNMMPFFYHFSPIFINHLNNCGIKLNNFYFIARGVDCTNPIEEAREMKDTINTMYFKYPLEILNLGPDIIQKNNKIYDFIIDPYSSCNDDYLGQTEIINNIRINNWFSRTITDINAYYRIFKIKKLTDEKKKKDYLILFSKSQNFKYVDTKEIYFTFSMKISQDEDNYPFIKLDEKNDILNFDYLSIYNFQNKFSPIASESDNIEKLFELDYEIDDSQNILLKTPNFISNMHLYSMKKLDIDTNYKNSNYKNGEYVLLKYNEMTNMSKYYDINYYFQRDSLIFRLIYFLNHFFLYKKNHPEYLTSNYDEIKNNIETNIDHPCSFEGSQEYYESIKEEYDYDCLNDFCFYNDCDQLNNNFKDPKYSEFLPNCYCIPLFCRDNLSQDSIFHNTLKDNIKNMNESYSDNAYSFTSTYNDYLIKKNYIFSKIDEYFDRNKFIFKCRINLNQKNNSYNNIFKTKIKIQNLEYQYGDNTFLMFFMNNNMTSYLVDNFLKLNFVFLIYVFGIYTFFVLCSLIILIRFIVLQVEYLTNRIEKIKKIRRIIISNQIENNNDDNSSSNSDQNNNLEMLNYDNNSSNSNSSDNSYNTKKKEKKENSNKKEKKSELDELDTLINLVNENVADFQIKFNLTEDMNSNINEIKNQYNGIIKVNQYKNKLLNNNNNNNIDNNSIDEDESSNISLNSEKEENFDDLSLKMFYELLSTSTTEIDFSNIKTNFYYRKNDGKYLFGLEDILPCFNDEDSNGNGEITNLNKIQNAINYYFFNIHNYWKKQYDDLKNEENI